MFKQTSNRRRVDESKGKKIVKTKNNLKGAAILNDTSEQLTKKPVQFDHVQLEVVNETVDIEEMAHQSHQAVTYSTQVHIWESDFAVLWTFNNH